MKPIVTRYYELKVQKLRFCETVATECDSPSKVRELWDKGPRTADWYDEDKECIVIFTLNTKLKCTGFFLIALGCINECTARVAEILKPAIINGCHSFIISHNHPSNDPLPSQADIDLTRRLNEGARIVGMKLQDHIIFGGSDSSKSFSFREGGLL